MKRFNFVVFTALASLFAIPFVSAQDTVTNDPVVVEEAAPADVKKPQEDLESQDGSATTQEKGITEKVKDAFCSFRGVIHLPCEDLTQDLNTSDTFQAQQLPSEEEPAEVVDPEVKN